MSERTELDRSELAAGVAAGLLLLCGGWLALGGDSPSVAGAVVLWTAALALAGVCLGRPTRPPVRERSAGDDTVASARRDLALAERLGLGPLGGTVGGAAVALAVGVLGVSGLAALLGLDPGAEGGLPGLGRRLWTGALWGLALGAFYRRVPGRSALSKGVFFSLLPAAWALFVEYPLFRGQGIGGWELGSLTFLLVIVLHLVWGAAVGAVLQWAELTSETRLDRPLGAPSP